VVSGPDAEPLAEVVTLLRGALAGTGPALLPVPGDTEVTGTGALADADSDEVQLRPGTALLIRTSGSTGTAKQVELSAAALLASARATHQRVGPPGRWALTLPLTHVAGWQVLVRGLLSPDPDDHLPAILPAGSPFTAARFHQVLVQAEGVNKAVSFISLVPTQLARMLEDLDAAAAASGLRVVLLGGAPTPEPLYSRAQQAGINVVRTYGSTETCGGCIYDGIPLRGVRARTTAGGRLLLAGPVLASGYRDASSAPGERFLVEDGQTWFVTSDLADIDDAGTVSIRGRVDDVIISGGEKVLPADVERTLAGVAGIGEAIVVGIPDERWGQAVVAVITSTFDGPLPGLSQVREVVALALGRHAAPQHLVVVDTIPRHGIGKPDRRAIAALAVERLDAARYRPQS